MKKYQVVAAGLFGVGGAIPIGTEFTTSSDLPSGWAAKVQEIKSAKDDLTTDKAAAEAKDKKDK